ncbi:hypothetical protein BY996DRAFT_6598528 [Phakopsora pachyrhizi]|nr:hypothetical protein BY996DRAFT_6598528 [Phakopsora pachyrhizi]
MVDLKFQIDPALFKTRNSSNQGRFTSNELDKVYFEGLKSKNLINQHSAKKKTESKFPDEEDLGPRAFDGEGNDNQDNYHGDEKPVGINRLITAIGLRVIDQILIARWITEEETEIR